jgi:transposase
LDDAVLAADGPASCTETRDTTTVTCGVGRLPAASGRRLARKGIESSRRLGRHRWAVEWTVSWLSGCRRLHRRYERKPEHFLAFTAIAATLICHHRLAN